MGKNISLLKETTLFQNLSDDKIAKILNICREVRFPKDTVIMKEGDCGDTMYIIIDGTVEVLKTLVLEGIDIEEDENIQNKVFTKLSSEHHAVFGEISLLENSKRTATVTALSDCVFYEINRNDFIRLADNDPELGYRVLFNIAKIVCSRLRKADEDVIKLTTVLSIVLKEA
ncbi:MAG: cyclic nucleotide-binding domain-containing protein [Deltaproteobacteria bacterium]|nr:cyclic nucleotide-binding domain-containing protein [Deltaproteobacteria bacterium]MBN2687040.1 cyclic nucleotide-binding domain-containing protein [Deltaproteobacteria bacterium]